MVSRGGGALALCLFLLLVGCRRSTTNVAPDAGGGSADASTSAPGPPLPAELEGVVTRCKSNEYFHVFACPELETWQKSALARGPDSDERLLGLLSDPRPLVRYLVVEAIQANSCVAAQPCRFAKDRKLSERMLAALEAERHERIALELSRCVVGIDAKATGLTERIERIVENGTEPNSKAILSDWLRTNPEVFENVVRFTSSPKPHLRRSALFGLGPALYGPHRAEACALAADRFGEGKEYDSLSHLIVVGFGGKYCPDEWDRYLTKVEKLEKGGLRELPAWLSDVGEIERRPEATPQRKARVLALAVRISESPAHDARVRAWMIGYAAQRLPDAQSFLQRLARDDESSVRSEAERWQKQRKGAEDARQQRKEAAEARQARRERRESASDQAPARRDAPSRRLSLDDEPEPPAPVVTERAATRDELVELLVPEGEGWNAALEVLDHVRWAEGYGQTLLTPDGGVWLTSAEDRLRAIDAKTRAQLYEMRVIGSGGVRAMAPDGSVFAVRREAVERARQEVVFVGTKTGEERGKLTLDYGAIGASAFTPKGELALLSMDGRIVVWSLAERRERNSFAMNPDGKEKFTARFLSTGPTDKLAAAASRSVRMVHARTGAELWKIDFAKAETVEGLAYDAGSGVVAVALSGREKALVFLEAESGREVRRMAQKGDSLALPAFAPDGKMLAATASGKVQIYEPLSAQLLSEIPANGFSWTKTGDLSLAWEELRFVQRPGFGVALAQNPAVSLPVVALAVSDDGTLVAAAAEEGMVRVFRSSDGALLRALPIDRRYRVKVPLAWKPRSHKLVIGADQLVVWDVDVGTKRSFRWQSASRLAFDRNGARIVGLERCRPMAYDAESGAAQPLSRNDTESDQCQELVLSPDGSTRAVLIDELRASAVAPERASSIVIRQGDEGTTVARIDPPRKIEAIAFAPDGQSLVAAGAGGLSFYDARSGAQRRELEDPGRTYVALAFSADGSAVAALTANGDASAWDTRTGAVLARQSQAGRHLAYAGNALVAAGHGVTLFTDPPVRIRFDSTGSWASVRGDRLLRHDSGTLLLKAGSRPGALTPLPPPNENPRLSLRIVRGPDALKMPGPMYDFELEARNDGTGRAYWLDIDAISTPAGAAIATRRVQRLDPSGSARFSVRVVPPAVLKPRELVHMVFKLRHVHGDGPSVQSTLSFETGSLRFGTASVVNDAAGSHVLVDLENSGTGALSPVVVEARFERDGRTLERKLEPSRTLAPAQRASLSFAIPSAIREDGKPFAFAMAASSGPWPALLQRQEYDLEMPAAVSELAVALALVAGLVLLGGFTALFRFWNSRRLPAPALASAGANVAAPSDAAPTVPAPAVFAPSPTESPSASASRTSSKPSRPPCAVHGIATGPDGRCALCRAESEPRQERPVLNVHVQRVVMIVGIALIGSVGYFAADMPSSNTASRPEVYVGRDASSDAAGPAASVSKGPSQPSGGRLATRRFGAAAATSSAKIEAPSGRDAATIRSILDAEGFAEHDIAKVATFENGRAVKLRLIGSKSSAQTLPKGLTHLSDAFGSLDALRELEISSNELETLPASVGKLPNLQRLKLNNNGLREAPSDLRLRALVQLDLSSNKIQALPESLGTLEQLTVLDVSFNALSDMPEGLSKLQRLTRLELSRNAFSRVPPGVQALRQLTSLGLSENNISDLPPFVFELTSLQSLYVNKNKLRAISPKIGKLTLLESLSLDANLLETLPDEIGVLTRLRFFTVQGNRIVDAKRRVAELLPDSRNITVKVEPQATGTR
jgi:WD40 repeat protein